MKISEKKIIEFQEKIFQFYKNHGRVLPWRQTTNPYFILTSEFMLQQTQVSRVIPYYLEWIKRWPTILDLANTPYNEVLQMWMGLGYNRRAQYLHETAKIVSKEFNGDVLFALEQAKKLPGIGAYTSRAVRIFSHNEDIATVDTNIRRIYIYEFKLPETISDSELQSIAEQCMPKGSSREWHNALMDYGALLLNASITGIKPKTKQSKFEGSDRQIRAKILRSLLKSPLPLFELQRDVNVDEERLKRILYKMMDEGAIDYENQRYCVS